MKVRLVLGLVFASLASPSFCAETVTYSYDALGRLTASVIVGGPTSGTNTQTVFDPAGNRTSQTVTGVPPQAARRGKVFVVPIGGVYYLIPIKPPVL